MKSEQSFIILLEDERMELFGFFICLSLRMKCNGCQLLIGVQGGDSFGKAEQVRPRRSVSDEEAHGPPEESGALHGNQQRY